MSRKGLIAIIIGVAVAILVTGGLVVAAGVGGRGCSTDGVRGQAAGEARVENCQGAGGENGACEMNGTCEGEGNCEMNGTCEGSGDGTCEGSGDGSGSGTCDGSGSGNCTGSGQGSGNGQQSRSCPMR